VQGLECWLSVGLGFKGQGLGSRAWGTGPGVQGLECWLSVGLGFKG